MILNKYYIVLLLFLIACTNRQNYSTQNNYDVPELKISNIDKDRMLMYSKVFNSIKYIKLETTEESLIGRIDKLIKYKDFYIILDASISKSVFVFDSKGRFLNKIGKVGKGVGEYLSPYDVCVNKTKSEIAVLNKSANNLIIYNINGEFIRDIPIPPRTSCFTFYGDNKILCYSDFYLDKKKERLAINIIDTKGNIEKKLLPLSSKLEKIKTSNLNTFQTKDSSILCNSLYSNRIVEILDDECTPYLDFNFEGHNIILDNLPVLSSKMFRKKLSNLKMIKLHRFFETSKKIIFSYTYDGFIYNGFYSKRTHKIFHAKLAFNDLTFPSVFTEINHVFEDTLIAYSEPNQYCELQNNYRLESPNFKEQYIQELSQVIKGDRRKTVLEPIKMTDISIESSELKFIEAITPTDNPIIMVITLKDF